jgi:hypothetical protein
MDLKEDKALWELLGRSPRPEAEGWFSARTLARLRQERDLSWLRFWRPAPILTGMAFIFLITASLAVYENDTRQKAELSAALDYLVEHPLEEQESWNDYLALY